MKFKQILTFSILTISAVYSNKENNQPTDNICLTPGCVIAAADILKDMDAQIDPCDDFYRFACGNFLKETHIPDDRTSISKPSAIRDTMTERLKLLVEEPIKTDDIKPFVSLKQLYKLCMNTTAIEANCYSDIKEILLNLGGWPVLEGNKWNEDTFDWKESVYKSRNLGLDFNYFIEVDVSPDSKNSFRRLVTLNQASLGVRQEILSKGIEDEIVRAYYDYMVEVAVIFGADRSNAKEELQKSFHFELELAKISLSIEQWWNVTALYNPLTINELKDKYPTVPWVEYINNVLGIPGIEVSNEKTVIVQVPQYIEAFLKLLKHTPKRVLANYAIWRTIHFSVPYLTSELRNQKFQLDKLLTGRSEAESRGNECVQVVSNRLGLVAGAMYVRRYFTSEDREKAQALVAKILSVFENNLNTLDWLDQVTRINALIKAAAITPYVGYSDELLDDKVLSNYYADISLNSKSFLKSILNINLFGTNKSFEKLQHPVNKTEWVTRMPPIVVNAQYSAQENGIRVPAAILQGALFKSDRPEYMNYGGIGFVISHEISHGFDDAGRHYDKDGNLVDWWTKETHDIFERKAQCLVDQYSSYIVPELNLNVNGKLTLDENIADNGGIKTAYLAYNAWVKANGAELQLPGLNYTANQMFWISAANVWCLKMKPEEAKLLLIGDGHSPSEFRVRGPFSNMDDFSNDFNCPSGSKMNPVNKCNVW